MDIAEMADSAAAMSALSEEAAYTYYDLAVKYGIAKYPNGGVRKSRSWRRFEQIARICMERRIPARKFVEKAFARTMMSHPMVTVADICRVDPNIVDEKDEPEQAAFDAQSVWNILACKLADMAFAVDGKSKADILEDPSYGFPTWYRVFATEYPVVDIIERWGVQAYEELEENKSLMQWLESRRTSTLSLLSKVVGIIRKG